MFSIPKNGWVNLTIENWTDRASYLTDVPQDVLEACISFMKNPSRPACISFDAEGWEYILIIGHYNTYVIEDKDEERLYCFEKSSTDLIEEIYTDINNNLYDWSMWSFNSDIEERRKEDEEEIRTLLKELRNLLDKYYNRYKKICCETNK